MASAVAVALNATRAPDMPRLFGRDTRNDITSASITTITVPAAGPNSSAAAIVNVSEIEKLTGTARIRNVDQPVTSVKATSMNHNGPTGCDINSRIDTNSTPDPAVTMTP